MPDQCGGERGLCREMGPDERCIEIVEKTLLRNVAMQANPNDEERRERGGYEIPGWFESMTGRSLSRKMGCRRNIRGTTGDLFER